MVVATGWEGERSGEVLFNGTSLNYVKCKCAGDLLHNDVSVLNATELCTKNAEDGQFSVMWVFLSQLHRNI